MMAKNNFIGLGTAAIGRPTYINIRNDSNEPSEFSLENFKKKGIDILNAAYESGIRYFDTAPGYGIAEQMLIDWVKDKQSNDIEVATKWGYTYVANFDINAVEHEVKEHSLKKLNEQWIKSEQLIPQLKIYQIHSATFETGVLDNKSVLIRLGELKDKYNLHIGITTSGENQVEVLKRALDLEIDCTQIFSVFQATYNIFDQDLAHIASKLLNQNKKLVIKEALANGRVFRNKQFPHYLHAYHLLEQLAIKYNVGVDAIALRFCLDSIPLYRILSGASNKRHLADNLKAQKIRLVESDIESLKNISVSPKRYWEERKKLSWN